MEKCAACKRDLTDDDRSIKLCPSCANALGVIDMPPARRKFAPCRACNGRSFIRAIPREVAPDLVQRGEQVTSPMAVTIGAQTLGWLGTTIIADTRKACGILEIYVCRGCGYTEWYCADPASVPIGPQFMTELVESETGPYR